MLSVDEALAQVERHAVSLAPVAVATRDALGRVLAEDVASDIDSPPYDKSIVDGYAIRGADLVEGRGELEVVEQLVAGRVSQRTLAPGQAIQIMTGAPIPAGADSVVMVERSQTPDGSSSFPHRVMLDDPRFQIGQNILRRASSMSQGQVVLTGGTRLRAIELGLLAEVGRTEVRVIPAPRVSVLTTGDELVAAGERPGPGQIRNSNCPMLVAAVASAGGVPIDLGVARDTPEDLRRAIAMGLESDVLVLSGGVSAGVLDLVPSTLAALGVEQVFHKIQLKPGKPLWFGMLPGKEGRSRCLVFGLPGNPVSSLVCFELFVRAAIDRLAGITERQTLQPAMLTTAFTHRGDRPTWHPARLLDPQASLPQVELLAWQGSGDLCTLTRANCLVAFPPGDRSYQPNTQVEVWKL